MFSLFDAFNLMSNFRSQASLARQMENQVMAQLLRQAMACASSAFSTANEDARYPHHIEGELASNGNRPNGRTSLRHPW